MIILDTETTGLQPGSRIIELGSVRVDATGKVVDTFHRMINPQMPLPADVLSINRITKEMLDGATDPNAAFDDWLEYIKGEEIGAAHYSPYDMGALTWALQRACLPMPKLRIIDTCAMAKAIKETANNKLPTLVEHYQIKVEGEAHRAIADCHACRMYYDIAKSKINAVAQPWASTQAYIPRSELPSRLTELPEAVEIGAPFTFKYQDAQGCLTERTITPYGWAMVSGSVMFHGMCHLRNERREFRADRVIA